MATYSNRRGGRGRNNSKRGDWKRHDSKQLGRDKDSLTETVDESPVVQAFREFQAELDCRNDRFERIVKISRDITIESKRVIFLLQRVIGADDPDKVFKEAFEKIQEINSTRFLEIAKELEGQDPYQFLRAYTNGLQEYIEAVTFYYYLTEQRLVNLDTIQNPLIFSVNTCSEEKSVETEIQPTDSVIATNQEPVSDSSKNITIGDDFNFTEVSNGKDSDVIDSLSVDSLRSNMKQLPVHIPASEYMMGVADFTGELMRMAIMSVGAGDLDTPKVVAGMMRVIHNAFSVFDYTPREMRRKATVLRQSLQKVETACYALTVRGSEIPKHMLTDVFSSSSLGADNYQTDDVEDCYD